MYLWIVFGLMVVVVASVALLLARAPFADVTRARVERFALRQSLPITVGNGSVVINYLATTRRWRAGGLILSLVGSSMYHVLWQSKLTVSALSLFVGWFVGAVIAEWRINVLSSEPGRRRASLARRVEADYLPRYVRWAVRPLVSVLVAVEIVVLMLPSHRPEAIAYLACTIAVAGLVWIVTRQVLARSQPAVESHLLAADESIRSRSLHVLAGALTSLCGFIGSAVLDLTVASDRAHSLVGVGGVVVMIFGLLVALSPSTIPRRTPILDQERLAAS